MRTAIKLGCGLFVLATFTPFSSAKPMPLEAPDPGRGIIGVRVNVNSPMRLGSGYAEAVYFVRVTEDADRFGAEGFINFNYTKGDDVYLLNAKPGRYVAVGCAFAVPGSGARGMAVFSKAAILQTEVEVTAGSITFMGKIEADSSTKTKESDEAQAHYLRMIDPTASSQGPLVHAIAGHHAYIATFTSIERGETTATEFWNESSEKSFKNDPAWASRVASRSTPPAAAATESPSSPKQP